MFRWLEERDKRRNNMSINLAVGLGREMKAYAFQNGEQVIKKMSRNVTVELGRQKNSLVSARKGKENK